MKVLHVCETAIGGIASYLNMLESIGGEVENVFVLPENHLRGIDSTLVVRTYRSSKRGIGSILALLRAVRGAVKDENPEILFFHSSFSLMPLVMIRLLGDSRPALYCPHGWAVGRYREGSVTARVVGFLEGRMCGLASSVVNVSQADMGLADRLRYRGRHTVIENAVPDRPDEVRKDRFADEPDRLHLLFVGRFDRQKGLDILLAAFARARRTRPDLRLHIVGSAVRADSGAIELPEGVSLIGWVERDEIDAYYASADAVVVPSRWEGFGLVVPESFRNGTPILCSDRGALPSLIESGLTGEVFSLEGESLVHLLEGLDKGRLRKMRAACRASYEERFGLDRFRTAIRAHYDQAIRLGVQSDRLYLAHED